MITPIRRLPQILLIAFTVAVSWLMMQAVHELGHLTGAKLSGGRVVRVSLHPLTISQTELGENPHPLIVTWMGPMVGIALPLMAAAFAWCLRSRFTYLAKFFAGFCLIANGAYVGIGSFQAIGDAGDLRHHGTPIGLLWLFGLVTVPIGLWMWNGLGESFGLGTANGAVDFVSVCIVTILLIATIVLELVFVPVHEIAS